MNRFRLGSLTCLLLLLGLAGCGYTLAGRGSFLPEDVKVIAIQPFDSADPRLDLADAMRQALFDEFSARGGLTAVEDSNRADAVLTGTITGFSVVPITFGAEDFASRSQVVVQASAELKRTSNDEVLYVNRAFVFRSEYEVQESDEQFFDAEPEVIEELAREFARSLVNAVLENF